MINNLATHHIQLLSPVTEMKKQTTTHSQSSLEYRHSSTSWRRLGFSRAAATLSLSFNCLLTATHSNKCSHNCIRSQNQYTTVKQRTHH